MQCNVACRLGVCGSESKCGWSLSVKSTGIQLTDY